MCSDLSSSYKERKATLEEDGDGGRTGGGKGVGEENREGRTPRPDLWEVK